MKLWEYDCEAYLRRKTREERRKDKYTIVYAVSVIVWAIFLIAVTIWYICGENEQPETQSTEIAIKAIPGSLPGDDTVAQEPVTYEDWFRENSNLIRDCQLTHCCCEEYEHICGTGDGLTSTGVPVTAYWTCAVDPKVIPYGSDVMIDYGNGIVEWRKAQDCGAWIKGNHIDLAVATHDEAYYEGVKYAMVYWR